MVILTLIIHAESYQWKETLHLCTLQHMYKIMLTIELYIPTGVTELLQNCPELASDTVGPETCSKDTGKCYKKASSQTLSMQNRKSSCISALFVYFL